MSSGNKIEKQEFRVRCGACKRSTEPGWLWLGGGDWVKCPSCANGYVEGLETRIMPTRRIFVPGLKGG